VGTRTETHESRSRVGTLDRVLSRSANCWRKAILLKLLMKNKFYDWTQPIMTHEYRIFCYFSRFLTLSYIFNDQLMIIFFITFNSENRVISKLCLKTRIIQQIKSF